MSNEQCKYVRRNNEHLPYLLKDLIQITSSTWRYMSSLRDTSSFSSPRWFAILLGLITYTNIFHMFAHMFPAWTSQKVADVQNQYIEAIRDLFERHKASVGHADLQLRIFWKWIYLHPCLHMMNLLYFRCWLIAISTWMSWIIQHCIMYTWSHLCWH